MIVLYIIEGVGGLIVISGIIIFFRAQEENEDFGMTISFVGVFILGVSIAFVLLYNRDLHPLILIVGMLAGVLAPFLGGMLITWLVSRLVLGPIKRLLQGRKDHGMEHTA